MFENPPRPPGVRLLPQRLATPAVGKWATSIVFNPALYPMFSESVNMFGERLLMIRVEYHTWTHENGKLVHRPGIRGATVYEVTDPEAYGVYQYNKMVSEGAIS